MDGAGDLVSCTLPSHFLIMSFIPIVSGHDAFIIIIIIITLFLVEAEWL